MTKQSKSSNPSRRRLLQAGAGIIGGGTLTGWIGSHPLKATATPLHTNTIAGEPLAQAPAQTSSSANITPDQALQKLIEGNQRFVDRKRESPNQSYARLTEVAQSQTPFAALLSCADSRVVPEIIFDQGIGDLFVVRVAGNISTTEDIASEEFGTLVLGAKVLLVLGHERCGAVKAAINGGDYPGLIESLVYAIQPAVEAATGQAGDRLENTAKANVRFQVKRLQTSPILFKLIQEGKLKIVGGYYDLDSGKVELLT